MKTYSTKASDIKREWHVIDASGKILGKLATQAANLLMGKHKPIFTRNLDTGDFVVIINTYITLSNVNMNKVSILISGFS